MEEILWAKASLIENKIFRTLMANKLEVRKHCLLGHVNQSSLDYIKGYSFLFQSDIPLTHHTLSG